MCAENNRQLLDRGVPIKLIGDTAEGTWTIQCSGELVPEEEEYNLVLMTPWRYHRLRHMEKAVHTLVRELGYNVSDD